MNAGGEVERPKKSTSARFFLISLKEGKMDRIGSSHHFFLRLVGSKEWIFLGSSTSPYFTVFQKFFLDFFFSKSILTSRIFHKIFLKLQNSSWFFFTLHNFLDHFQNFFLNFSGALEFFKKFFLDLKNFSFKLQNFSRFFFRIFFQL